LVLVVFAALLSNQPKGKSAPVAAGPAISQGDQQNVTPSPPALAPALVAKKIAGETEEQQIKTVAELAAIGKADATAIRVLCEVAAGDSVKARNAALDALEKLSPRLYAPLLSLLVEDQRFHYKAIREIVEMGEDGKQALLVLFKRVRLMSWANKDGRTENMLSALGRLALTEPETLEAALWVATNTARSKHTSDQVQALCLLGTIGKANKQRLNVVIPPLMSALKRKHEEVSVAAAWILSALADDAKEIVPALRDLRFCENPVVRTAVLSALRQIESKESPYSYTVDLNEKCGYREARYVYLKAGSSVEVDAPQLFIMAMSIPDFSSSGPSKIAFVPKMTGFVDITVHGNSKGNVQIRGPGLPVNGAKLDLDKKE